MNYTAQKCTKFSRAVLFSQFAVIALYLLQFFFLLLALLNITLSVFDSDVLSKTIVRRQ